MFYQKIEFTAAELNTNTNIVKNISMLYRGACSIRVKNNSGDSISFIPFSELDKEIYDSDSDATDLITIEDQNSESIYNVSVETRMIMFKGNGTHTSSIFCEILKDQNADQRPSLSHDELIADVKYNVNSGSNELLVNLEGHKCVENSTTEPLDADDVFVGSEWQSTLDYGVVSIAVNADKDSAVDGLIVQWSADQITVGNTDVFTIYANEPKTFTFGPANQYVRIRYVNGSEDQGFFSMQTLMRKVYVKPSSHRIKDNVANDDDAELVKSIIAAEDQNGAYVNVRSVEGTTGNNLKVSLDQVETTTNSVKTMSYSHAELHSGDHYFYKQTHLIAKAGVLDLLIVFPDTTRWGHVTIDVEAVTSQILLQRYRRTTVSANGTLKDTYNRNQNIADNNTIEIYEAPTITTVGDLTCSTTIGSGKRSSGGGERDNNEIIGQQGTNSLIRITEANIQATYVNVHIDWYEHTSIT